MLFLCVFVRFVFSQDGGVPDSEGTMSGGVAETVINGLIAGAEVQLSNAFILFYNIFYNKYVEEKEWAVPNRTSIRNNFTKSWEWDNEPFGVNQIGHPYQASVYFSAGRVNNFGFYESMFFAAFGSSTWEIFYENEQSSINDFITTTTSSLSTGEILYRLYLEAYAAGVPAPLALFINPMAGIHRLITGWEPPDYGRRIYSLQVYSGGGFAKTRSSLLKDGRELLYLQRPFTEAGLSLIYGNPFEQESKTPFEHFELVIYINTDFSNFMDIRANTDGYLFSFSPVYSDTDNMSTGLSLHWDIASKGKFGGEDSLFDQYSTGLDWTIKYQHLFSENTSLQVKFHTGATIMGVFFYYSPDLKERENSYGAGINSKLFVNLNNKMLGKIEMSTFGYMIWCYPGAGDLGLSKGNVYWLFADIAYSYPITNRFSIGIANSFLMEWGFFKSFPDTLKYNNAAKLFIAWNF